MKKKINTNYPHKENVEHETVFYIQCLTLDTKSNFLRTTKNVD